MKEFIDRFWAEYPIPKSVSIWGDDPSDEVSLKDLISICVKELQSDLYIRDSLTARSNVTSMPADTIAIISARFLMPVQGNTYVKKTYIRARQELYLRYYPAIVTFRRRLTVDNIEELTGDKLLFFKAYVNWKAATKEVTQLDSVQLNADNGEVNLQELKTFRDAAKGTYELLKDTVLLYTTT